MSQLHFAQLNAALSRCMAEHPPEGQEHRLHADANLMGGLWARMVVERLDTVDLVDVDVRVQQAIELWSPAT
ncbi:MAG: hypothetical protein DI563_05705 [Variovorax paradoxus]|uniref:DUF3717 domain-containing protein n=1 Tax=Variovorax paradoxus TaxID=34073 RepID=A0A2W5QHV2_VARPD|nr:MAG: hypothetical protein DI563_05705 [Variovorax paradoxus]